MGSLEVDKIGGTSASYFLVHCLGTNERKITEVINQRITLEDLEAFITNKKVEKEIIRKNQSDGGYAGIAAQPKTYRAMKQAWKSGMYQQSYLKVLNTMIKRDPANTELTELLEKAVKYQRLRLEEEKVEKKKINKNPVGKNVEPEGESNVDDNNLEYKIEDINAEILDLISKLQTKGEKNSQEIDELISDKLESGRKLIAEILEDINASDLTKEELIKIQQRFAESADVIEYLISELCGSMIELIEEKNVELSNNSQNEQEEGDLDMARQRNGRGKGGQRVHPNDRGYTSNNFTNVIEAKFDRELEEKRRREKAEAEAAKKAQKVADPVKEEVAPAESVIVESQINDTSVVENAVASDAVVEETFSFDYEISSLENAKNGIISEIERRKQDEIRRLEEKYKKIEEELSSKLDNKKVKMVELQTAYNTIDEQIAAIESIQQELADINHSLTDIAKQGFSIENMPKLQDLSTRFMQLDSELKTILAEQSLEELNMRKQKIIEEARGL